MNWFIPPKWKFYCCIFAMPLYAIGLNLILFNDRLWHETALWLYSVPLVALFGFIGWYLHVLYDHLIEQKFKTLYESKKRILWKMLVFVWIVAPMTSLLFLLYDQLQLFNYRFVLTDLAKGLLVSVAIHLIFESLFEGDFLFSRYRESREETKTIQQLAVINEFDTLKNQVNPHFLFNCFNTLSSLISVDKQNAEAFLNELSKVYRYLLRINEEGVSTLRSEVNFIASYYKLLQTRHGEAVRINMNIYRGYESYLLPSLTLQLLVENVVKHNVLSKNKPLIIDIFTTAGNKLVVNNNLQRRSVKAPSNRVGLDNIRAKYELLREPGFQVMEDDKNFTVVLPLMWKLKG